MLNTFWQDMVLWWSTVPPEFVFLLALPFAIAGIALLGERVRSRRGRSQDGSLTR